MMLAIKCILATLIDVPTVKSLLGLFWDFHLAKILRTPAAYSAMKKEELCWHNHLAAGLLSAAEPPTRAIDCRGKLSMKALQREGE